MYSNSKHHDCQNDYNLKCTLKGRNIAIFFILIEFSIRLLLLYYVIKGSIYICEHIQMSIKMEVDSYRINKSEKKITAKTA